MDTVRKIQAEYIDAGANQIPQNRNGVGGGAKRGNDFCSA
jgi:hypothetical protein